MSRYLQPCARTYTEAHAFYTLILDMAQHTHPLLRSPTTWKTARQPLRAMQKYFALAMKYTVKQKKVAALFHWSFLSASPAIPSGSMVGRRNIVRRTFLGLTCLHNSCRTSAVFGTYPHLALAMRRQELPPGAME